MRILLLALLLLQPWLAQANKNDAPVVEPWLQQGWQALEKQGLDTAIDHWQQGVNQFPAERILLTPIGFFSSPDSALKGVHVLGIQWRGIVLKGYFHGQLKYFVLSAPSPEYIESVRDKLGQLLAGGAHRIYGWSASRFQAGGSYALPESEPTQTSAVAKTQTETKPTTETVSIDKAMVDAEIVDTEMMDATPIPPQPAAHATVHSGKAKQRQLTPEQESRIIMKMAKEARAQGNRKKAIALLTEVLKRTPEHARARLMSGKLMIEDGQYDAAWQVMRPLLKAVPLDWKPWFWSGTAELMVGKLNDAAKHFDEALARNGQVAAIWVQRSLVAQQRGRYAVSYQLLKIAETQAPKSVQVMLNLGLTLDALGRKEAARAYYQRYLVQTSGTSSQWQARKAVIGRLEYLSPKITTRSNPREALNEP